MSWTASCLCLRQPFGKPLVYTQADAHPELDRFDILPLRAIMSRKGFKSMAKRILVVDDDPEIVRLLRAYLEQSGYQALCAYDGESALHIIRRERPDLVLLDLMLPERDGWEVIRMVRSDESLILLPYFTKRPIW